MKGISTSRALDGTLQGFTDFFTIKALPQENGRKTRDYQVVNTNQQIRLGYIQWYAQWRQYVLAPTPSTVWSRDCLDNVLIFMEKIAEDRKTNTSVGPGPRGISNADPR